MSAARAAHTVRPGTVCKGGRAAEMLDPFTAEKLVAGKQAELRAEARPAAQREAVARESNVTEHLRSIREIRGAGRLVLRTVTNVWNGSVKGAAGLVRASR